jgi:Yip1 domain
MSADNDQKPGAPRFSIDEARARAKQALQKSEHMLSRAWGLLRDPKAEWEQIRAEETTIPNILIGYVAPLAALPPLCGLLGSILFQSKTTNLASGLIVAIVTWLVGIAMVFLLGIIISVIAENFDSERDELAAQKIAAYALTPFFLSTVALLWPPLLWVPILALGVMVYLIYRGLPPLMKTPPDRAMAYAATITIAALVTFVLQMAVASCAT